MWWYALQIVVGGSIIVGNAVYHWTPNPLAAWLTAVAAAAVVTAFVSEPLGFFRWIMAKLTFGRSVEIEPPQ